MSNQNAIYKSFFKYQNKKEKVVDLIVRILFSILVIFSLVSCKDDTPYIPVSNTFIPKIPEHLKKPKTNAVLWKFSHFFYLDSIEGLDLKFQLDSTQQFSFKFTNIKYIISKVELKNQSGNWVPFPQQYGLINLNLGVDSFYLKDVPNGTYSSVRFQIGLDSVENHGDPMRWPKYHPLDPSYCQMHWGWQGGYIFHATEGKLIRGGQETGFSFHLGGIVNRTQVELPLKPLMVNNSIEKVGIKHNLHQYYFGNYPVNFLLNPLSSHSESDTVFISKLKSNLPNSFQVN